MSADNWAICPRCVTKARTDRAKAEAAVEASYGRVSIAEFQRAQAALTDVNPEDYRTFREDYEIYGAGEGVVTVDYSGGCTKCGLSVSFTEKKPIPGVTP
jgi:hypothetical protein